MTSWICRSEFVTIYMRRTRKVLQPQRSFSLNGASGRFSHSKRDLDANALSHDAVLLTLEAANLLAVITLYSSTFPVIRNVVEYRIGTVELQIVISCQGHQIKKGSIPRLFNASAVPTTLWNELLLIFEVFDWHLVSFLEQKYPNVREAAFLSPLSLHQDKLSYFHI